MKFNKTVWNILVLFYPPSWVLSGDPYCPSLDKWWVSGLKQGHRLHFISQYKGVFRGKEVWVANSPHCCGRIIPEDKNLPLDGRPSRAVMLWMHFRYKRGMKDLKKLENREINRRIIEEIGDV